MRTPEAKMRENVVKNFRYLMNKYGISQNQFGKRVDVLPAQMTRYMSGQYMPKPEVLVAVSEEFECTVDNLLKKNMADPIDRQTQDIPVSSYTKYTGLYQTYFYDTSSFKGRERAENAMALRSGLLYIEKDWGTKNAYRVVAVLNMRKAVADVCFKKAKKENDTWEYMTSLNASHHVYFGNFKLSANHFFINVSDGAKDNVQMIFHVSESSKDIYIGGLGAMVSVSKGRRQSPCMQYIGLSDVSLDTSEEMIASHLLMHYGNIKTYETIDELSEMLIQLYQKNDVEYSRLSADQRKLLLRNHIDKVVTDTVERNLFRTVLVSAQDDDEWYHFVKSERVKMKGAVM